MEVSEDVYTTFQFSPVDWSFVLHSTPFLHIFAEAMQWAGDLGKEPVSFPHQYSPTKYQTLNKTMRQLILPKELRQLS